VSDTDDPTRVTETLHGPIAFLADIHGNLRALDAVLAALHEAGVGAVFVCGDLLLDGDDPLGVWMRLQKIGARCVRGTTDRALATVDPARLRPGTEAEAEPWRDSDAPARPWASSSSRGFASSPRRCS
jgi:hypothetical protein